MARLPRSQRAWGLWLQTPKVSLVKVLEQRAGEKVEIGPGEVGAKWREPHTGGTHSKKQSWKQAFLGRTGREMGG